MKRKKKMSVLNMVMDRWRPQLDAILSTFVSIYPHETSPLLNSSSCFFFILSASFVVLPLRDEGAISLGLSKLPALFIGSLFLTLIAAPLSTLLFSFPNFSKSKALFLIHRFFSVSLVLLFFPWHFSSSASAEFSLFKSKGTVAISTELKEVLKVALLNLITISSTWARVIDVMDSESGSRLFGFIGAGATLGQLFGSLFATSMAWLGPFLLLFAALLMELAAQSSKGIDKDVSHLPHELSPIRSAISSDDLLLKVDADQHSEADGRSSPAFKVSSPKSPSSRMRPQLWVILDGFRLVLSSTYLLNVSLFLWLSAVISSFFYFQKVTVIAMTVSSSLGRRKLFAQINSFIAVFILAGQLTLTGRILTLPGVTAAICSAPVAAFSNLVAIAVWPTWVAVAICETVQKLFYSSLLQQYDNAYVSNYLEYYLVTRPGRELLFTVVTQEEKYKAKVCIDVIVQRLGDATAAGMYKLLFSTLHGRTSTVSLYALPITGNCISGKKVLLCGGYTVVNKFDSINLAQDTRLHL
ncbi:hypothetical protein Peur_025199 [Populus x canadensis]